MFYDEHVALFAGVSASPHPSGFAIGACNWTLDLAGTKIGFVRFFFPTPPRRVRNFFLKKTIQNEVGILCGCVCVCVCVLAAWIIVLRACWYSFFSP